MDEIKNASGNYRIEVSGWGLNSAFFVEKTDLVWTAGEQKKLRLHHALSDRTVVFVRLIGPETSFGSVPVAYQVEGVQPMDSEGLCEMRLLRLHPRSKTNTRGEVNHSLPSSPSKTPESKQIPAEPELQEAFHEA
jgi:hypothetical protein